MEEEVLKQLIKEMEYRVEAFKLIRDLNREVNTCHAYWDGKYSEAQFVLNKLNLIQPC